MGIILMNYPCGTSIRNLYHYSQSVLNANYSMYDFGKENCKVYSSPTAPFYDLSKMSNTTKILIYYGSEDKLANRIDLENILKYFPESAVREVEEVSDYGHSDFIWATEANEKVYLPLIEKLKKILKW